MHATQNILSFILYCIEVVLLIIIYILYTTPKTIFGGYSSHTNHTNHNAYNNRWYLPLLKNEPDRNGHTINKEVLDSIDKRALAVFNDPDAQIELSHLYPNAEKALYFYKRITQDSQELEYSRRRFEWKRCTHWGQLKLLLSEVEFCVMVMYEYNKHHCTKPIYLVYAGAAPCHHAPYLSKLFPSIHFELYDPNPFSEHIGDHPMIKTHQQFFLDEDAKYWFSKSGEFHITFVSDIRTEPASDENIIRDMKMQLDWYYIMQPELSMFKFRPIYGNSGTTEFAKGDIYTQTFPGQTSTETRLIVFKNAPKIQYDNKKYESQLYYHNTIARTQYYSNVLGHCTIEKDGLDNCYDCTRFVEMLKDYCKTLFPRESEDRKWLDKAIRQYVIELQQQVHGHRTIQTQTQKTQNEALDFLRRSLITPCKPEYCNFCRPFKFRSWEGVSVATTEALESAKKNRN